MFVVKPDLNGHRIGRPNKVVALVSLLCYVAAVTQINYPLIQPKPEFRQPWYSLQLYLMVHKLQFVSTEGSCSALTKVAHPRPPQIHIVLNNSKMLFG